MSVSLELNGGATSHQEEDNFDLKCIYIQSLKMFERLHFLLQDVVKDEFDRHNRNDISSVQAMLLYYIGDDEVTAGELRSRGYYLGSNVSYNLKKLVDGGFVHHERSVSDKRSVRVRLSEKGKEVCGFVDRMFDRQLISLKALVGVNAEQLETMNSAMQQLERYWSDQIRFQL